MFCEAGKFLFSVGGLTLNAKIANAAGQQPGGGRGFLNQAMQAGRRMLAGESLAFQHVTNAMQGTETVAFAGVLPGEMGVIELDGSRS